MKKSKLNCRRKAVKRYIETGDAGHFEKQIEEAREADKVGQRVKVMADLLFVSEETIWKDYIV